MIGLTQYLIVFVVYPQYNYPATIHTISFGLISFATLLIAGAGNVINDFFDQNTDNINCVSKKVIGKSIKESSALIYYISLNLIALIVLCLGLLLLNQMSKIWLFIACGFFLYLYSKRLKGVFLLGNLVVSLLIVISLWVFPFLIESQKKFDQDYVFEFLVSVSILAFLLNLTREINKDIEDIKGDYASGHQTLPILLGRKSTHYIIYFLLFLSLVSIQLHFYFWIARSWWSILYFTLLIFTPLLFVIFEYQKNKINYKKISLLLKISMCFGLGSLLFI